MLSRVAGLGFGISRDSSRGLVLSRGAGIVAEMNKTLRNIIAILILLLVFGGGYLFLSGGLGRLTEGNQSIILELDLEKRVVEDSGGNPLEELTSGNRPKIQDLIAGLEAAGRDNRVKLLIARIGNGTMGWAQRQDLREAITKFRKTGKKAYAFSETFGEFSSGGGNYYLATGFDQIFLQPSGDVGLTGFRAEPMFFRGALDKLEIVPRGGQRYEYKNALDVFTEKQMTPPFREAIDALLKSFHQQLVNGIVEGRKLTIEQAQQLVDGGPYLGTEAVKLGLADRLMYRDEVYQQAESEVKNGKLLYLDAYLKKRTNPFKKGKPIAIVYGVGGVQRGESKHNPLTDDDVMGSDTVCAAIRAATDDKKIKVILFRVDSPGGSYVASDAILRELARAQARGKKIVISMGNVAASGGYIVSLAADRVIAQPATITGSIGVLAFKLLTRDFWANKLGITYDSAQTSRNADMFSSLQDYSPEELAKFNAWLDRIYQEFTDKVASGRKMPKERVLEIAKGRVWSGEDAKRLGLIDELGSFQRAVAVAKELSGIPADENVKLMRFPKSKSIFDMFKKPENSKDVLLRSLVEAIAPLRPAIRALSEMDQSAGENVVSLPIPEFEER